MIAEFQQKARGVLEQNASAILTAGGVVGTVATAVLTGRASVKAYEVIAEMEFEEHERASVHDDEPKPISRAQKIGATWHLFLPPVGVGSATIAAIVMSNRISATKAAALAAAYGISERRFEEYKEKTLEKLGVNKEEKLRDEIAQDRVNSEEGNQVIMLGEGEVLCYDMITGRFFKSTAETIRKAQNDINMSMIHYEYASLTEFYEDIGLPPTNYTDEVGWNLARDGQLEVRLSSVLKEGKPCLAVDFNVAPHPSYNRIV